MTTYGLRHPVRAEGSVRAFERAGGGEIPNQVDSKLLGLRASRSISMKTARHCSVVETSRGKVMRLLETRAEFSALPIGEGT